jgi:hypothetical protein
MVPAGLPIFVLNLHCIIVNIRTACLDVKKHCTVSYPLGIEILNVALQFEG